MPRVGEREAVSKQQLNREKLHSRDAAYSLEASLVNEMSKDLILNGRRFIFSVGQRPYY